MIILVDMDGVIADFEGDFIRLWKAEHPDKEYIDIKDRQGFYLKSQYPKEYHSLVEEIYYAPGFYKNLPIYDGCKDALKRMTGEGHIVYLCTSPMIPQFHNCVLEKYEWVEKHLGTEWVRKLIMAADKTMVKGDILIDDRPEIKGAIKPEWEHVLYDQYYNRSETGKRRLTWQNYYEVLFGNK